MIWTQPSNILIDILEFGEEHLKVNPDFKIEELKKYLLGKKYDKDFVDSSIKSFIKDNFEVFLGNSCRLNSNGYSILLNHRNLNTAWRGIWLATGLAAISILVTLYTTFRSNDTKIEKTQYEQIIRELDKRSVNTYTTPSQNLKQIPSLNKTE